MTRRRHASDDYARILPADLAEHPELAVLATLHQGLWLAHLALATVHPALGADRMYHPDDPIFRVARTASMSALNLRRSLQEYLDVLRVDPDDPVADIDF